MWRGILFHPMFCKTRFGIANVSGFSKSYKYISDNSYEYFEFTVMGNSGCKISAAFNLRRGVEKVELRLRRIRDNYAKLK